MNISEKDFNRLKELTKEIAEIRERNGLSECSIKTAFFQHTTIDNKTMMHSEVAFCLRGKKFDDCRTSHMEIDGEKIDESYEDFITKEHQF